MSFKNINDKREYQRVWIANRRLHYINKFGGCCSKCSSSVNLEFHHVNKELKVDNRIWSWSKQRIELELSKCQLLCRVCHHHETAKERNYYSSLCGTITAYKNYQCRCDKCKKANAAYEHFRRLKVTHVEG